MKRYEHAEGDCWEAADGEWVLYADHAEAMKRIAGESPEPYNAYQRDWEKVVRWVKVQSETFPELANMSPEGAISWLVVELAARHEKFAEPSASPELTDEQIQSMWNDACKDGPGRPGWSRHIRFARAVLAASPAGEVEPERREVCEVRDEHDQGGTWQNGYDTGWNECLNARKKGA